MEDRAITDRAVNVRSTSARLPAPGRAVGFPAIELPVPGGRCDRSVKGKGVSNVDQVRRVIFPPLACAIRHIYACRDAVYCPINGVPGDVRKLWVHHDRNFNRVQWFHTQVSPNQPADRESQIFARIQSHHIRLKFGRVPTSYSQCAGVHVASLSSSSVQQAPGQLNRDVAFGRLNLGPPCLPRVMKYFGSRRV